MTMIIIEEDSPQAKKFLEYAATLPFATVVEEQEKDFRSAMEECDTVSVDEFFDELDQRIKSRFHA